MEKTLHSKINFLIKANNIFLNKNKGQNFLIDQNIVNKIIEVSDITQKDTIIEIGPGLGSLTQDLVINSNKVIAFELDKKVCNILQEETKNYQNLKIINQDFLKVDLKTLNQKHPSLKIVANLPYSVSSLIILKILQANIKFKKIILMVQKEMATRIMAKVGKKKYNAFTIMVNYLADVKVCFDVSNKCFIPKPKVTSSVIELKLKNTNFKAKEKLFAFIKKLFLNRRKTILNNLATYLDDKNQALIILEKANIKANLRPQNLTLKDYEAIYEQIICKD